MIEHQLASVPSRQSGEDAGHDRQDQPVRQDRGLIHQTDAPVHSGNGNQCHRGNRVGPAGNAHADARHQQQLGSAYKPGSDAGNERKSRRPDPRAHPERIAAEPVEHVATKRRDHEGDRKVHAHRMQRMPGNRNRRGDGFGRNFFDDGAVGLGIGFAHEKSPSHRQSVNIATWFPIILLLTGCTGPYSALEPEGPSAQGAATLWWIMAVGAGLIFLTMCIVLALALLKPRPVRAFGPRRMLLWGGVVVPSIILTALVIAAFALGERLLATPREDMPLRIEAIARQWQWEFRYPDGSSTIDLVHMPTGQDVDFAVTTEDVIHGFWIPRLGGKIDAIPGHTNVIRLRADRPGTYGGVCAEFCGVGHSSMYFRVEAHDQQTYEALTLRADEGAQQ